MDPHLTQSLQLIGGVGCVEVVALEVEAVKKEKRVRV